MYRAVRRTIAIAGVAGLLVLTPALASSAHAVEDPSTAPVSSEEPPSGCEENPVICQSGGPMETPVECAGLPTDDQGIAVGEPNPATPTDPAPDEPKPDTGTATITPEDPPVLTGEPADFCIAANGPGAVPEADQTGGGGEAVIPVSGQLPRTGPAPLLESVAIGSWLLLLGVLGIIAGRRRTAWM